jgi:hypothetical protein
MADAARAYREAHPEKHRASMRKYAKAHLAERRARQKARYQKDPTKWRQYAKKYRERYPEKVREAKRALSQRRLELNMWKRAKRRAEKKHWEFNIEPSDVVIPERCPLLEIELCRSATNATKANAPSLDRLDPVRGYVKGNVWVISLKANTMKNNGTLEELELLVRNLRAATTTTSRE